MQRKKINSEDFNIYYFKILTSVDQSLKKVIKKNIF